MKMHLLCLMAAWSLALGVHAQVGVNATGSSPHPAAGLDVDFSDKGFLPPRMNSFQRDAIVNPPAGLRIYNTSTGCENYYNGTAWYAVCGNCIPGPPSQPSAISGNANPCAGSTGLVYSVNPVAGVTYNWILPAGWNQTGGGTSNSITVTAGSSGGTIVVVPSNTSCGSGTPQSLGVTVATPPASPTAGSHLPSTTSISWNWNTVAGATGYRYSLTNNYGSATDAGNSTNYVQSGLTCNTPYTLYVWAYNACGNSSVLTLSQTTSACVFSCGGTISHGYVAGITPSTDPGYASRTYTTVQANAAWGGKCWTKMNLGATAEATSSVDSDANRAGWYFQFNRLQGFHHDGSTRTPSAAWITAMESENSAWTSGNDPCLALLGTGWRIPTESEWNAFFTATQANGGMESNTGSGSTFAYNSALKLHAGGKLESGNGSLSWRGFSGRYWSSTQHQTNLSKAMTFYNGAAGVINEFKAQGCTMRCVKD